MYAVLVKVRIDPARHAEAISGLHENVVPKSRASPASCGEPGSATRRPATA